MALPASTRGTCQLPTMSAFYSCMTIYQKLSGLKQLPFITSQSYRSAAQEGYIWWDLLSVFGTWTGPNPHAILVGPWSGGSGKDTLPCSFRLSAGIWSSQAWDWGLYFLGSQWRMSLISLRLLPSKLHVTPSSSKAATVHRTSRASHLPGFPSSQRKFSAFERLFRFMYCFYIKSGTVSHQETLEKSRRAASDLHFLK